MLEKREFDNSDFFWRLSTAITVVAALFSFIVFVLIVINYLQIRAVDPVDNEMLTQMRKEYAALPKKDEVLAQRIRDLDLINRKAFFTSQDHLRVGAFMLLTGVCVFLIAFKSMIRWKRELPNLDETPTAEKEFLAFAESRQLITWGGVIMLAGGMLAALFTESALTRTAESTTLPPEATSSGETTTAAVSETTEPAFEFASWETIEQNWTSFRGPGSNGIAHFDDVPAGWDVASGSGVRWKVEVPLPGTNSPVVWEDRLFISSADDTKREVYCYDTDSGELLWSRTLENLGPDSSEIPAASGETGFAASTMAIQGRQVFAVFANGDVVSYDFDGNQVWGMNLGLPDNHYGHSSSLVAYEDLVFVQYDHNSEAFLMAVNAGTGDRVWTAERDSISWASPTLAHTEFGPQLLLNSESTVTAYNPATGEVLWSEECLSGEVAPSPAYADGIVFAANEYAVAVAIQISGSDDAVESEIIWEYDDYLPEVSSPIGDGERFYFATSVGDLVSLDAKTGEELWIEEFDSGFYSSPVLVGDKIYILDMEGTMHVVEAGAEYNPIAQHAVGEPTVATPAFLDGRIYLRTEQNLYCIEEPNG